MATCGMSVEDVNIVLDRIISRYEKFYANAPLGKKFQECYDTDDIQPTEEYVSIYDSALNTLSNCGIDF